MENEQRGRVLRASSTSSLGREVRCGCQFYQSDSLLPERCALVGRPPSRTMMQTPTSCVRVQHPGSEHEYELIASPPPPPTPAVNMVAPVVRITDTDVMPVADSDDSIDDRGRYNLRLTLDGDIILPLDGKIEDNAMEGRELGETIDTSDEMESEQIQENLKDSFTKPPDPDLELKIKEEIIPSQVNPAAQEQEKKQSSHGFQEKLRIQADKLSSRFKGFQRPSFTIPARHKSDKKESTPVPASDKSKTQKASRLERFKMALPERPRFSFTGTSKLNLKKRPKVNIKRPNIHMPAALTRSLKRSPSLQEQQKQRSTKSTYGSHKNIFNFSTYPRLFDRKAKSKAEYVTSSPKETRAHDTESATYPRSKMNLRSRWGRKIEENKFLDEELADQKVAIERTRPWRHPSLEEPRLAFRIQASESLEESEKLPWEVEQQTIEYRGEIQYADYEEGSQENSDPLEDGAEVEEEDDLTDLRLKQIESFNNNGNNDYTDSIPPLILRQFEIRQMSYEENSPGPSNLDQQSSRSSYERHCQDVIEEINSENLSFREGDSHDELCFQKYITRDLQKTMHSNSYTNIDTTPIPPQRPSRTRSLKKRKEKFFESFNYPHTNSQSKSEQVLNRSGDSLKNINRTDSFSKSAHRIVYRAETVSREQSPADHLDDIIIVKPTRRKSKASLQSQSEAPIDAVENIVGITPLQSFPPAVPRRRKRTQIRNVNGDSVQETGKINFIYNGHSNILRNSLLEEYPLKNPLTSSSINSESKENFFQNTEEEIFDCPPIPPKRRSRSRTASFIQDEEHSLHDIELIPEVGYIEDGIPLIDSQEQLSGYAIIEKHEKRQRPSPPRRRRHKSATTLRPTAPKRPQRAYSTLGPSRKKASQQESMSRSSDNMAQYFKIDSDEEQANLRNEVLSKVQSRPLPAPPRPPRSHRLPKTNGEYYEPEVVPVTNEVFASTQTDPLPEDVIIDEEITQAKLVMTPSRYGSQVLISTERIPTPTLLQTSSSPQMMLQSSEDSDSAQSKEVSNKTKGDNFKENMQQDQGDILRAALFSDEPIRINNLEVGDLRVDRLSVSQLEAFKIAASEIDAIVISASEMTGEGSVKESVINPAILQELVAIRSHLETVAQVQERPASRTENASLISNNEEINITTSNVREQDEILNDPKHEVEFASKTTSGRVHVEKLNILETKTNQVTEQRVQPSSQSKILQTQVLQVEILKPESEVGTVGRDSSPCVSSSREPSREKDELVDQKERSWSRTSTLSCESQFPKPLASSEQPLPTVTSCLLDTTETLTNTSSEILSQRTNTSHIEGRGITFQTSQIPAQFFSLASPISQPIETEPSISETARQLLWAIRIVGTRNLRHFVNYLASCVGREEASDKIREVELVLCALLLIVAGLLIMLFGSPRTVTHHYHWDYFNPPQ